MTATASAPSIPTPQQLRRASSGASTKLIRRVTTQDRIGDILEVCPLAAHLNFLLITAVPSLPARQGCCWIIPVWQSIATGPSVTCASNRRPMTRPWTQPHYSFLELLL